MTGEVTDLFREKLPGMDRIKITQLATEISSPAAVEVATT